MERFSHKRLDVYRVAMDYVADAAEIFERIPRRRAFIGDQLLRAATSIPLNIAEGAGEFSRREKARFYRIARRSATESAAILHVLCRMQIIDERAFRKLEDRLDRITAMLTRMAQSFERADTADARNAEESSRPQPQPRPRPD